MHLDLHPMGSPLYRPVRLAAARYFVAGLRRSGIPEAYRIMIASTDPSATLIFLGAGLLATAVAAAGTGRRAIVLEPSRTIAGIAQAVAQANGLALDRLQVVATPGPLTDPQTYLRLGGPPAGRLALVCERLAEDGFGERLVQTLGAAKKAWPCVDVIPQNVELWAAPLELRFEHIEGLDLAPLDGLRASGGAEPAFVRLDRQPGQRCRLLAEPLLAVRLHFAEMAGNVTFGGAALGSPARVEATTSGKASAVAAWFRVPLGNGRYLESCPQLPGAAAEPVLQGWRQAVWYLDKPLQVEPGQPFWMQAHVDPTGEGVSFTLALSGSEVQASPRKPDAGNPGTGGQVAPIQSYHFMMVTDSVRNKALLAGIRAALALARARGASRPRLLDIGTGSGLLAMLAERLGAEVVAVEMVPGLRAAALEAARLNSADVTVLPAQPSTALSAASVGTFDVVVAEVFDTGLLGEGCVPIFRHARELLRPGGVFVPARAAVFVQPLEMDPFAGLGLDMGALGDQLLAGLDTPLRLSTLPHRALGPPAEAFCIDFACLPQPCCGMAEVRITATDKGALSALAMWFELRFDGDDAPPLSTATGSALRAWKQVVHFLARPHRRIAKGEAVALQVAYTEAGFAARITEPPLLGRR